MTFDEFCKLLEGREAPVVLLEGTRELPEGDAPKLTSLAAGLARKFPHAVFRSGNAKGSDEAFAKGVAQVDASRLEFVIPYAGHRSGQRPSQARTEVLDGADPELVWMLVETTRQASPDYQRLALSYLQQKTRGRSHFSAQLILRDTLKVIGGNGLAPPVAGIFFVHSADPERGGTGHTIRVCRAQGVPVA